MPEVEGEKALWFEVRQVPFAHILLRAWPRNQPCNIGFSEEMVTRILAQYLARFAPPDPVHIFHHLPKCGGSSVREVIGRWFLTLEDYREGWTMNYPNKKNIKRLRSCHCLVGHFELDGFYLHQRYPGVFEQSRYRVFTFVRDPLHIALSRRRYLILNKPGWQESAPGIEEHLLSTRNYLANRFPATQQNYKEVIDRYWFLGIFEQLQSSMDQLADRLDKPKHLVPRLNATLEEGREVENVSDNVLAQFREQNALDYLIYDYCVAKYDADPRCS